MNIKLVLLASLASAVLLLTVLYVYCFFASPTDRQPSRRVAWVNRVEPNGVATFRQISA